MATGIRARALVPVASVGLILWATTAPASGETSATPTNAPSSATSIVSPSTSDAPTRVSVGDPATTTGGASNSTRPTTPTPTVVTDAAVPVTIDPTTFDYGTVNTVLVAGTACVPVAGDSLRIVSMTVDRFGDQIFTARPSSDGSWTISLPVTDAPPGTYRVYPDCHRTGIAVSYLPASFVIEPAKSSSTSHPHPHSTDTVPPLTTSVSGPSLAATGSSTTNVVATGLTLVTAGLLLLGAMRLRRRAGEHV
jgi:hypothetical protein